MQSREKEARVLAAREKKEAKDMAKLAKGVKLK